MSRIEAVVLFVEFDTFVSFVIMPSVLFPS